MNNELKTVQCGCGGEAYYEAYENYNFGSYIAHIMICDKCGMRTAEWPSEAEAITAWNRAMGAKDINVPNKFVTDTNVGNKERTAKIIGNYWRGVEYFCGDCKKKVLSSDDYCSHCGAKLDWSKE